MDTIALQRPQPVGVFPLPASYLLLPAAEGGEALAALMRGDAGAALPDAWRCYALALAGDLDGAFAALDGHADELAAYNRFVLRSDPGQYHVLRARSSPVVAAMLDLVAFTLGYVHEPPALGAGLQGELLALALSAHASHAREQGNIEAAIQLLERAVAASRTPSPMLAAQLLGQCAMWRQQCGDAASASRALVDYRDAIALAADSAQPLLVAELWLNQGLLLQERAGGSRNALLEAVKCYQSAIRSGLSLTSAPESFALAHNNLALAYLSMPMVEASDQLRMAVAVQSLREALKVYTKERYPEQWASTQLNLANALQYLPSSHPQDNLVQAVRLYEEVLSVRDRARDPLGYARVIANQANALAHLGMFQPALEKLNEAHKLFHWHNEPDLAASALAQVAQINERMEARV